MSLACWMVVYAPQVWENYQLQSGEGLSVAFVILWLAGDLTGLAGSIMAGLIPSVIILALYVSPIISPPHRALLLTVRLVHRMRRHSTLPDLLLPSSRQAPPGPSSWRVDSLPFSRYRGHSPFADNVCRVRCDGHGSA